MALGRCRPQPGTVPQTSRSDAVVLDLVAFRERNEQALAALASAPVRFVPAALLEALQGSWGTPEELGLAPTPDRHLRVVGD